MGGRSRRDRAAIAARRRELGLRKLDLDHASGLQSGYTGKIEAGVRRLMAATGRMPVVCAHSMGGLALRRRRAITSTDSLS